MAAGVVQIPWYATFFRAERFAEALAEIAPVSLRYGATEYSVQQSRDDKYKFLQLVSFPDKLSWERYWSGPEFVQFREEYTSWYQVPVLYVWHDELAKGRSELEPAETVVPEPAPEPEPSAAA